MFQSLSIGKFSDIRKFLHLLHFQVVSGRELVSYFLERLVLRFRYEEVRKYDEPNQKYDEDDERVIV